SQQCNWSRRTRGLPRRRVVSCVHHNYGGRPRNVLRNSGTQATRENLGGLQVKLDLEAKAPKRGQNRVRQSSMTCVVRVNSVVAQEVRRTAHGQPEIFDVHQVQLTAG